jgi:glycosyltransferase involved in cell wall biosynthesis
VHNQFRLLQVSTYDSHGGAARVALDLHRSFVSKGVDARLAVGKKFEIQEDRILEIENEEHRNPVARVLIKKAAELEHSQTRGVWRLSRLLRNVAEPKRSWDILRGIEDFHFPGTEHLLKLHPKVDLIHCHNLHGDYFDLRQLPALSHQIPVALTLHDAWLLSGHCAHSLGCDRWIHGCGECPDLNLYPKIKKDRTHFNWLRKQDIYRRSRLYVVTPCQWLMDKVQASILAPAILDHRIIPNGVDLTIFRAADKQQSRETIHAPKDRLIALISGSVLRENPVQDLESLLRILAQVETALPGLCLILGSNLSEQTSGKWKIRSIPFVQDRKMVAHYYQAADVLLHPSKADTFPMAILEALACGLPVIATSVGGIPEQIRGVSGMSIGSSSSFEFNQATGILVPPDDLPAFVKAFERLMQNENLRKQLGQNAAEDASHRFSLERMADAYLTLHTEILEQQQPNHVNKELLS